MSNEYVKQLINMQDI